MHLSKLPLLCLLLPSPLLAAWSGINFSIGDESIPIISDHKKLTLTPFNLHISVEDKTSAGLHIGAAIAKNTIKIDAASSKIDTAADSVGLYFYFPYQFNDAIGITSRLSITKFMANPHDDKSGELDYLTKKFSLGLNLKWQNWRITPSIHALTLKGDFKDTLNSTAFSFTQSQTSYTSLSIDYFAEHNSFIRLYLTEHSDNTFRISFVTIY